MSKKALVAFLEEQIAKAKTDGVLFSLHLKATMMKVSDPIIFGHAVSVFFKDLIAKHAATLAGTRRRPQQRLRRSRRARFRSFPPTRRPRSRPTSRPPTPSGPALAMVNSDKGITNLHVPSDVIVDASMPAMIRASGKMWNAAGQAPGHPRGHSRQQLRRRLPDHDRLLQKARRLRSQAPWAPCRTSASWPRPPRNTARTTRPSKFPARAPSAWSTDASGNGPPRTRRRSRRHLARLPDQGRAGPGLGEARRQPRPRHRHARRLLARRKARARRPDHRQGEDLSRRITTPRASTSASFRPPRPASSRSSASRPGKDTISVTGNVLRDYLTDLFPILEVGTSAKMLSIVPLMNGGGLFETGAGGSAPKHVAAVPRGKLPALGLARRILRPRRFASSTSAKRSRIPKAKVLADTLDAATGKFLENDKSPGRKARHASTTAAATSTSRSTGPRRSPRRTTDAELKAHLHPDRRKAHRQRREDRRANSSPSRASPWTSAATTSPTTRKPPPRCARARRSTRSWPRSETAPDINLPIDQGGLSKHLELGNDNERVFRPRNAGHR